MAQAVDCACYDLAMPTDIIIDSATYGVAWTVLQEEIYTQ